MYSGTVLQKCIQAAKNMSPRSWQVWFMNSHRTYLKNFMHSEQHTPHSTISIYPKILSRLPPFKKKKSDQTYKL